MIEVNVNLALQLLDGFTGKPLKPSQVQLTLDGQSANVIHKPEGWAVLVNLPAGAHDLRIESSGYQSVKMTVQGGDKTRESVLRLRPDENYRFGGRVTTLHLTVTKKGKPVGGEDLYLLIGDARQSLRISQDNVEKGAQEMRMFASGKLSSLPIPGAFYLENSGKAVDNPGELVEILGERQGVFTLSEPLRGVYKRGCKLSPVEVYRTDGEGKAFLALRGGESIRLLAGGSVHEVQIKEMTRNDAEIKL